MLHTMHPRPTSSSHAKANGSKALNDYQLGDSLGKGAFGQVYRALNWATGETVAVKEIQLSNIPKAELGEIMSEIDLLKNLNHENIVKYKGFVKTREYLYIILEFCENGSLHNIVKKFGKFPENLVAVYISQVLEGLVYLHDQGVIHRDIKGANILTNKDGTVKLADFGVASSVTAGAANAAVVGSPYWMAPEVIEQSGATTASDIWSVGCLVIELLEGHPPYHDLDPMPALFRIVQDDCPPIPDGASPIVKDFLYHCFQKDSNLRISAKKLLRHPWMVSARKQLSEGKSRTGSNAEPKEGPEGTKKPHNYNFDEALAKVQEWNEALKSPSRPSKHPVRNPRPTSPLLRLQDAPLSSSLLGTPGRPGPSAKAPAAISAGLGLADKINPFVLQANEEQTDNWDDDFEEGISFNKLQALDRPSADEEKEDKSEDLNAQTIRPSKSPGIRPVSLAAPPSSDMSTIVEDYSDLAAEEDEGWLEEKVADFKLKNPSRKGLFHPDDIKTTVGLAVSSAPGSASVQNLSRKSSRSGFNTMNGSTRRSNGSSGGSVGQADAKKIQSDLDKFDKYAETDDDDDYEDVFGKPSGTNVEPPLQSLRLNTRLSNKSWFGTDDSDEEDPFAEIDEGFSEDDLDTNLQRDKHARLCNTVNQLVDELSPSAPEFQLQNACNQLIDIMEENPEMQPQLVSSHGMLAILEVLEARRHRDVTVKLLQIINMLVGNDIGFLESFCLIGGIPVLMEFTSKKYPSDCRLKASNFIKLLCNTSIMTLQMFISCRGLKVLVDLLDEDYTEQEELVVHALNGISNVFELQSPTTKNDFCRMFIREGLLDPLSLALLNVMAIRGESTLETKMKIIQTLLVFCQVSQSDVHVRNALGTRQVIRRLLRACELLEPECLVLMLKAVKHLSMNATLLEVLQNANAIEILIRILEEHSSGPHSTEMSNHIFQTCYNLCRLNKTRQEEAAQAGILPCLKRVIETRSPLKQFALPILCDLAAAGKSCRNLLWQHDGLRMYLRLLDDPYFQVSALESILSWLQDETGRIEDQLLEPEAIEALLNCFVQCKANSFENLLDPFLKLTRISTPIILAIAKSPAFFKRVIDKLGHNGKAVVRLNLLKLLRSVVEVHPNRTLLVDKYGLLDVVEKLSKGDVPVLVRELAREIVPTLRPVLMKSTVGVGGTTGHVAPATHRLKARAGSIDRSGRDLRDNAGDRSERDSLRSSISSNGSMVPRYKKREDSSIIGLGGVELREREREGHKEKVLVKKLRRASSEASAAPLRNGTNSSRRTIVQAPSDTSIRSGRERRLVSSSLGLDRSVNGLSASTSSRAPLVGSSQFRSRLTTQKLDDVAAWLEGNSGPETD